MLLIIVEDDQGIMDKFEISAFDNAGEAQVAALDVVIEWFEDMDNHDQFTDMIDVANDIKKLEAYKVGVKDGQYDETDEFEVSGFMVRGL